MEIPQEIYLRPAWRSQWGKMILIILLLLAYPFFSNYYWVQLFLPTVSIFLLLKIFLYRYSTYYMIGPKGIEKHQGIISVNLTRFEYRHVRGADMRQTIMNRLLGIGYISVATSGMDEDILISDIKNPQYYTDLIFDKLKEL